MGCETSNDQCDNPLSALEDNLNLRCYDQERRFGVDFLYPFERYVDALTNSSVTDRYGNVVDSPIFSDLNASDDVTRIRDKKVVFMTALVRVPWQDLARQDSAGTPDILAGLAASGLARGGYQNPDEMVNSGCARDRQSHGRWFASRPAPTGAAFGCVGAV